MVRKPLFSCWKSHEAAGPPFKYQTKSPLFCSKVFDGHSLPKCSCLNIPLKEHTSRHLGILHIMSSSIQEAAVLANLTSHQLAALSDVPILPPPPGLEPNLHNAEHNGSPFFIVTSVLLFLTTILMINRAYAKTYIVRKYTWDDCKPKSTAAGGQANAR